MSILSKEQVKEMIKENNYQRPGEILSSLKGMFKDVLQEMLEAELESSLGYEKYDTKNKETENSRNGHSKKTLKTTMGNMQIDVPRDRDGEFDPKIIPKYERDISKIEEKVIALYSRGMSTRDINKQIADLYGIDVSAEMVSKITDKVIPLVKEWQSRPFT